MLWQMRLSTLRSSGYEKNRYAREFSLAVTAMVSRNMKSHSPQWNRSENAGANPWASAGLLSVESRLELELNTNDGAIEAALRGFGLACLLSYQVARHCESGELTLVLEKHEPPPRPIHIVHREGRQASAKVRTFVDLMFDRLSGDTKRV